MPREGQHCGPLSPCVARSGPRCALWTGAQWAVVSRLLHGSSSPAGSGHHDRLRRGTNDSSPRAGPLARHSPMRPPGTADPAAHRRGQDEPTDRGGAVPLQQDDQDPRQRAPRQAPSAAQGSSGRVRRSAPAVRGRLTRSATVPRWCLQCGRGPGRNLARAIPPQVDHDLDRGRPERAYQPGVVGRSLSLVAPATIPFCGRVHRCASLGPDVRGQRRRSDPQDARSVRQTSAATPSPPHRRPGLWPVRAPRGLRAAHHGDELQNCRMRAASLGSPHASRKSPRVAHWATDTSSRMGIAVTRNQAKRRAGGCGTRRPWISTA